MHPKDRFWATDDQRKVKSTENKEKLLISIAFVRFRAIAGRYPMTEADSERSVRSLVRSGKKHTVCKRYRPSLSHRLMADCGGERGPKCRRCSRPLYCTSSAKRLAPPERVFDLAGETAEPTLLTRWGRLLDRSSRCSLTRQHA